MTAQREVTGIICLGLFHVGVLLRMIKPGAPMATRLGGDYIAERKTLGAAGRIKRAALWLVRWAALRLSRTVVVPSRSLCQPAIDWGARRDGIVCLSNPVGTRAAPPPNPEAGTGALCRKARPLSGRHSGGGIEQLRCIFIGRLVPTKRVDIALHAIEHASATHLTVVGDGPQRGALEKLARQLHIADRVSFMGAVEPNVVAELLALAHALVLPSLYEGSPNVVGEALTAGIPVVASDVGGVGDLISDHENGLLLSVDGGHAVWAEALNRLRADPDLLARLSRGAQEFRAPSWDQHLKAWLQVLTE